MNAEQSIGYFYQCLVLRVGVAEHNRAAITALRAQADRENQKPCHLCQRRDDYQLFCRGQEMDMDYCAFCGRKLDHEPKEAR